MMDYVDWCRHVLAAIRGVNQQSTMARTSGIRADQIAYAMFPAELADDSAFWQWEHKDGIFAALISLESVGVIERTGSSRDIPKSVAYFKLTADDREHLQDPVPLWRSLTAATLEPDEQQVLAAVNHRSPLVTDTYARPKPLTNQVSTVSGGDDAALVAIDVALLCVAY
jgi:hypothetical protein